MKVTVDKCPWTGRLFEDPVKFAAHLGVLRSNQRDARERARIAANFEERISPLYGLPNTDGIRDWLDTNYMMVARHLGFRWGQRRKTPYVPTVDDRVTFEFRNMRFDPRCSTTHAAPRGQRHTGWDRVKDPHVPEPGWRGTIGITFHGRVYREDLFDTDHLGKIGIHTGCGGGGDKSQTYEVTMFLKDFGGLARLACGHVILEKRGEPGFMSSGRRLESPQWASWRYD